jgi:hypothetical protein
LGGYEPAEAPKKQLFNEYSPSRRLISLPGTIRLFLDKAIKFTLTILKSKCLKIQGI